MTCEYLKRQELIEEDHSKRPPSTIGRLLVINEVRIWLGFVSQIIFIYIFNQLCAMYIKAKLNVEFEDSDSRNSILSFTNDPRPSINSFDREVNPDPTEDNDVIDSLLVTIKDETDSAII